METKSEADTVEEVFAQARKAEATAEELLVDDGWKVVEVEPETVSVNGNGNGNGHHDDLFGPTVELVPANSHGHASAPANGLPRTGYGGSGTNGHDVEDPEPQQSLFSWAEFMAEEPVKPRGPQAEAPARDPLDVRVGDDAGTAARTGAGRRWTLGRRGAGEDTCNRIRCLPPSPNGVLNEIPHT